MPKVLALSTCSRGKAKPSPSIRECRVMVQTYISHLGPLPSTDEFALSITQSPRLSRITITSLVFQRGHRFKMKWIDTSPVFTYRMINLMAIRYWPNYIFIYPSTGINIVILIGSKIQSVSLSISFKGSLIPNPTITNIQYFAFKSFAPRFWFASQSYILNRARGFTFMDILKPSHEFDYTRTGPVKLGAIFEG